MSDLRALLGDKYVDAIERAAAAMDEGYNPDRYSILTAMFRESVREDYLAAVLPDLLAAAWDEGFDAMSDTLPGDYYPPTALGISNPYRDDPHLKETPDD